MLDGMINYFQFVLVVVKAIIEIMFEPKALRQRAELIEKTDLSPEALLQGMSSDMFEQRVFDLQLTYGEIVALMAAADKEPHGYLRFVGFFTFCFTHNLLNFEREKRLRLLQLSMQKEAANNVSTSSTASICDAMNEARARAGLDLSLAAASAQRPGQQRFHSIRRL